MIIMMMQRAFLVRFGAKILLAVLMVGPWNVPTWGAQAVYPVKVSSNHRYLVDRNNKPFLIVGDCPQSLTVNLSLAQTEMYFSNRQAHGFNVMWANLLCTSYTGGRPGG